MTRPPYFKLMKIYPKQFFAALAAALLAAGCLNTAMFKTGAFVIDDWDTWTSWNDAYGTAEVRRGGLYYHLTRGQDDTRDRPSEGYSPGLLLSRELQGKRWQADLQAEFKMPQGAMKRFSCGIWAGEEAARPSLGSSGSLMKLLVQRQNGPGPAYNTLTLIALPGGAPIDLPLKLKTLRFERAENIFTVAYSLDGKKFIQVLRVDGTIAADAPSQKFFLGGFAGGDPAGAYARFRSLRINGREVLR